jgi:hypothetical protein
MPARPICIAHAAHGFAGLALACAARDCAALRASAHRSGHRSRAHVTARPPAALPWRRWSKRRRLSIHGGEPTRRASGWRRQLTVASCRREGWRGRGSSGSSVPGEKGGKGGGCSRLHSPWRGSRRRRRPDSGGGALGQRRGRLRTRETVRSGRVRVRRGEGGVGSAAASSDTAGQKRPVRTAFNPPGRIWTSPPMAAN